MKKITTFLIFLSVISSCSHMSDAALNIEKKQVREKLKPAWLSTNCIKDRQYYYFVGFGTGQNFVTATQNAFIDAKKNSLLCLFGGTIEFSSEINETLNSVSYKSGLSLRIASENVDWTDFEKNREFDEVFQENNTNLYVQYKWKISEIKKIQAKLKKVKDKIEKNALLKREIFQTQSILNEKNKLIEQRKKELNHLKEQNSIISKVKKEIDETLAKIEFKKKNFLAINSQQDRILANLYCGMTMKDFIDVLGPPDDVQYETNKYDEDSNPTLTHANILWKNLVVQLSAEDLQDLASIRLPKVSDKQIISKFIYTPNSRFYSLPLQEIKLDKGFSGRRYWVCR